MTPSRHFEILFDGTWQEADQVRPSNVARMKALLAPREDGDSLYLRGVGTGLFHFTGGLFGVGLSDQVKEAYEWLRRKEPARGDRVSLTGFSRGSYAARSFSGLLFHCGIRPGPVDEVYQMYRTGYKDTLTPGCAARTPVIAHLLALDTVGALGIPSPIGYVPVNAEFHDTSLSPLVQSALHLVAAHETRRHFVPTFFTDANEALGPVEELWCPGVHVDVGGGGEFSYFSNLALLYCIASKEVSGSHFLRSAVRDIENEVSNTPPALRRINQLRSSWLWPEKKRERPDNLLFAPWMPNEWR